MTQSEFNAHMTQPGKIEQLAGLLNCMSCIQGDNRITITTKEDPILTLDRIIGFFDDDDIEVPYYYFHVRKKETEEKGLHYEIELTIHHAIQH